MTTNNNYMSHILKNKLILESIIINYFGHLSIEGQNRLLSDLKRTPSQYLCCEKNNSKIEKSVKQIGVPTVNNLKSKIKQNSNKIDNSVNWRLTSGVKKEYSELVKVFKIILSLCEKIYAETKNIDYIKILLTQLKGNKYSILRSLAMIKYKSISPGKKLVGKQTTFSNNKNIGYVEEHIIPAKFFMNYFIEKIKNKNLLENETAIVLTKYFSVFLNTDDNDLLSSNGFNNTMPKGWDPLFDSPFIRYEKSGIDITTIIEI